MTKNSMPSDELLLSYIRDIQIRLGLVELELERRIFDLKHPKEPESRPVFQLVPGGRESC